MHLISTIFAFCRILQRRVQEALQQQIVAPLFLFPSPVDTSVARRMHSICHVFFGILLVSSWMEIIFKSGSGKLVINRFPFHCTWTWNTVCCPLIDNIIINEHWTLISSFPIILINWLFDTYSSPRSTIFIDVTTKQLVARACSNESRSLVLTGISPRNNPLWNFKEPWLQKPEIPTTVLFTRRVTMSSRSAHRLSLAGGEWVSE